MSIKQKVLNTVSAKPKLVALSIGIVVTMAIGTAIGMLDHHHLVLGFNDQSDN